MTTGCIKYRQGFKYQLAQEFTCATQIYDHEASNGYYTLTKQGQLTINAGYAWDGPSGPTVDTPAFMRGALVHDCLYQMIRDGKLPESARKRADEILYEFCRLDGMGWVRAQYVYRAVRMFGKSSSRPGSSQKVRTAP